MPYISNATADTDNKGNADNKSNTDNKEASAVSEQASADKLEYTATLGIIAMEGRGFEYPTDMVAASNGRLYVANRSRDFGERGVRVTVARLGQRILRHIRPFRRRRRAAHIYSGKHSRR